MPAVSSARLALATLPGFEPDRLQSLANDFDDFLGMLFEGYGREDWRAIDESVLGTDIGRLVQQRREIIEQSYNANVAAGIEEH
jgi:hypothetical protein